MTKGGGIFTIVWMNGSGEFLVKRKQGFLIPKKSYIFPKKSKFVKKDSVNRKDITFTNTVDKGYCIIFVDWRGGK